MAQLGEPGAVALFERLQRLEDGKDLGWLGAQPWRWTVRRSPHERGIRAVRRDISVWIHRL